MPRGKTKKTKQAPLKLGPATLQMGSTFSEFLEAIAKLAGTRMDLFDRNRLEWKFHVPATSRALPLATEDGFAAMKNQLSSIQRVKKAYDPIVTIGMPAPRKDPAIFVCRNMSLSTQFLINSYLSHGRRRLQRMSKR